MTVQKDLYPGTSMEIRMAANDLIRRVVARFVEAEYPGWDPPDYPDEPDPSELWDRLVDAFPHSMRKLLDNPKRTEKIEYSRENLWVTDEVELDLDDDVGGTVSATAYQWVDADEDGEYGETGVKGEYYLVAGNRTWKGSAKKYGEDRFVQDFKRDVREFLEVLKRDYPVVAEKYHL